MNPLTQFKIFKKIPILPLLIPLVLACFDPSGTCHGDSGAPTFFDGEDGHGAQVIDIASDGKDDCATVDVRTRVDTPEVRAWIFDTIAARLGN